MPRRSKKKIIQSDEPFAICIVSVAALRARPFHEEEMVSQLLFGELVHIIEKKNKHWYRVSCEWDGYEGWVDAKQIFSISEKEFRKNIEHQAYALELVHSVMGPETGIPICIGSTLPRFDGISCKMPEYKMAYTGLAIFSDEIEMDAQKLIKLGMKYIHSPYMWGGRSPFGIDGSGLIQMIYKLAGIRIPRDANEQVALGENVDFPSSAQPSDIAFFDDAKGIICHAGMITEDRKILHAYGKVRLDYFDHHGIYNEEIGKYTHKLRVIKRLDIRQLADSSGSQISASNL